MHADDRLSSGRGRRPLGAAGAAGTDYPLAAAVLQAGGTTRGLKWTRDQRRNQFPRASAATVKIAPSRNYGEAVGGFARARDRFDPVQSSPYIFRTILNRSLGML